MTRFLRMGMCAATLVALGMTGGSIAAQEKKAREYRGRLPNGWTRIGLSDEQEQKIRDIQIKNHDKISRLEEELEKLKDDERKAIKKVLNADQLKMVENMEAAAKKKKSAKAKPAAKSEKDDDEKATSKPKKTSTKKKETTPKKKDSDG